MGICGSRMSEKQKEQQKREQTAHKKLEKQINDAKKEDEQTHKLLLLGAGESGKSTIFKQMRKIYGTGFNALDRENVKKFVWENLMEAILALMGAAYKLNIAVHASHEPLRSVRGLDEASAKLIKELWSDPGIQEVYEQRSKFQLMDSAEYFFNDIDRLSAEGYEPTDQDLLRVRVRTTGIVSTHFTIDDSKFVMFDVGGQRNERRKWIHQFENVTAVLFIGVLSEYNQQLYEDEECNRMVETLGLFNNICNSEWFVNTSIILFLNKRDLFAEKIVKVPLSVCPVFKDDEPVEQEYEAGVEAIREKFVDAGRREDGSEKVKYIHMTCATDTDQVTHVFNDVKDILIRQSLEVAGLLNMS